MYKPSSLTTSLMSDLLRRISISLSMFLADDMKPKFSNALRSPPEFPPFLSSLIMMDALILYTGVMVFRQSHAHAMQRKTEAINHGQRMTYLKSVACQLVFSSFSSNKSSYISSFTSVMFLFSVLSFYFPYLVIAIIRLANETSEPTTENQIVVLLLILDVFALVLLGVTYKMSFCCR